MNVTMGSLLTWSGIVLVAGGIVIFAGGMVVVAVAAWSSIVAKDGDPATQSTRASKDAGGMIALATTPVFLGAIAWIVGLVLTRFGL